MHSDIEWELIEIIVDSGACDWVASKRTATKFRINSTDASLAGVRYGSACGAKIYNEELHVLTSRTSNIKSFADLKGKRVNTGGIGSGTKLTAQLVLKFLDTN